jgi:hypothetical protein
VISTHWKKLAASGLLPNLCVNDCASVFYVYQVHGLTLSSEFLLPELARRDVADHANADVLISEGAVPPDGSPVAGVPELQLAGNAAIFDIPQAGRFLVRGGREVVVEKAPGADMALLRLFLFGSVMGLICHQRGLVGLHASAVAIDGRAVAFTGQSGAGKSTLAAHCLAAGARLVADDLLVLSFERDGVFAHPGMPNVKLWRDALTVLGRGTDGLSPDWWRADKFHMPAADVSAPVPLTRLHVLDIDAAAGDGASERLQGRAAASSLIANTFRVEYLDAAQRRDSHFRDCMRLASALEVVRFRRAADASRLTATAAHILGELRRSADRVPHDVDRRNYCRAGQRAGGGKA